MLKNSSVFHISRFRSRFRTSSLYLPHFHFVYNRHIAPNWEQSPFETLAALALQIGMAWLGLAVVVRLLSSLCWFSLYTRILSGLVGPFSAPGILQIKHQNEAMNTIRRNSVSNTDENRENAIRINTTEEKFCCSYLSNSRIMLCTVFSQVVVAGIWEYCWKSYTTIRMRVLNVFSSCVSPTTYGSHEATTHQRCIIHMNEKH